MSWSCAMSMHFAALGLLSVLLGAGYLSDVLGRGLVVLHSNGVKRQASLRCHFGQMPPFVVVVTVGFLRWQSERRNERT